MEEDADVLAKITALVKLEVQAETTRLRKRTYGDKIRCCKFCPYRKFQNAERLLEHVETYHTLERLFTAILSSQAQWSLVVALYNQSRILGIVSQPQHDSNLLETSATLLREWNPVDEETAQYLGGRNEFDVVLCLCATGPKHILKS